VLDRSASSCGDGRYMAQSFFKCNREMTSSRRKNASSFHKLSESPETPGFVVSKIAMKL
jgi:hypothetical protein